MERDNEYLKSEVLDVYMYKVDIKYLCTDKFISFVITWLYLPGGGGSTFGNSECCGIGYSMERKRSSVMAIISLVPTDKNRTVSLCGVKDSKISCIRGALIRCPYNTRMFLDVVVPYRSTSSEASLLVDTEDDGPSSRDTI